MKLQEYLKKQGVEAPHFISEGEVTAIIEKFLVTDKDGTGRLPVDDARHMGAAWAALHGGYRGNKYSGPDKAKAIAKLKALYKSRGLAAPSESYSVGAGFFAQEGLAKDDSYDSLRCKVECAVNYKIRAGQDMDCDGDGEEDAAQGRYAYVMDLFPQVAIYSMEGSMFQVGYAMDTDGDIHLSDPEPVQLEYAPKAASIHAEESFQESYQLAEGSTEGDTVPVTVIKPGWSLNNRYYGGDMLKRDFKIFEGAKMFANHQTDAEQKARPEGDVRDWVANLSGVFCESDGTVRGLATFVDPTFKEKVNLLRKQGLISQLGVSIRAMGEASDGEIAGKRGKIVEAMHAARSVDFVTFAGAGGKAE